MPFPNLVFAQGLPALGFALPQANSLQAFYPVANIATTVHVVKVNLVNGRIGTGEGRLKGVA
jgi:hypothetical protein